MFVCLSLKVLPGNPPQFISQRKLELYETFRMISWWSVKMIYDVKYNTLLQVLCQEPSTSSKYDLDHGRSLTHFKSCQRAEIWHTSKESHTMMIDVKDNPFPFQLGNYMSLGRDYMSIDKDCRSLRRNYRSLGISLVYPFSWEDQSHHQPDLIQSCLCWALAQSCPCCSSCIPELSPSRPSRSKDVLVCVCC